MARIQLKRGLRANVPTASMLAGEAHFATDRGTLHVAVDTTTTLPIVPPIDELTTLAAVDGAADFVMIHDASEAAAQKEKKITFDAFKTALTRMARAVLVMSTGAAAAVPWVLADNTVIQADLAELTEALALAGAEQARLWVL